MSNFEHTPDDAITVPDFKPEIFPPDMLANLTPDRIWLYNTISKMSQMQSWQNTQLLALNHTDQIMSSRLAQNEITCAAGIEMCRLSLMKQIEEVKLQSQTTSEWKTIFSTKWSVISTLGILIVTAMLGAAARSITDFFVKTF